VKEFVETTIDEQEACEQTQHKKNFLLHNSFVLMVNRSVANISATVWFRKKNEELKLFHQQRQVCRIRRFRYLWLNRLALSGIFTIVTKAIFYLMLMAQSSLFMVFPVVQQPLRQAQFTDEMNSYDDYLIESCLGIPDPSPADESDDAERVLQIVRIEEFHCLYTLNDFFEPVVSEKPNTLLKTRLLMPVVEVIVQPPQA